MCEMQTRTLITCVAAALVVSDGALADTPDRRAVKSEMKSLWDSLDTFAFRCDQVPPDDAMPSNSTRAHFRFDMAHGTGGRWALTWSSLKTGTPRVLECFREDGRRR